MGFRGYRVKGLGFRGYRVCRFEGFGVVVLGFRV